MNTYELQSSSDIIKIPEGELVTNKSPLTFVGYGVKAFGQPLQQNILDITTHFERWVDISKPLRGMLHYVDSELKLYNGYSYEYVVKTKLPPSTGILAQINNTTQWSVGEQDQVLCSDGGKVTWGKITSKHITGNTAEPSVLTLCGSVADWQPISSIMQGDSGIQLVADVNVYNSANAFSVLYSGNSEAPNWINLDNAYVCNDYKQPLTPRYVVGRKTFVHSTGFYGDVHILDKAPPAVEGAAVETSPTRFTLGTALHVPTIVGGETITSAGAANDLLVSGGNGTDVSGRYYPPQWKPVLKVLLDDVIKTSSTIPSHGAVLTFTKSSVNAATPNESFINSISWQVPAAATATKKTMTLDDIPPASTTATVTQALITDNNGKVNWGPLTIPPTSADLLNVLLDDAKFKTSGIASLPLAARKLLDIMQPLHTMIMVTGSYRHTALNLPKDWGEYWTYDAKTYAPKKYIIKNKNYCKP